MKTKLSKEERNAKKIEEEKTIAFYWNNPEIQKTSHLIIIGDNREMMSVKDDSIHLIVTSPPYFNAKIYSQWTNIEQYIEDMRISFSECFRVLKPGRKFCLNISDLPIKGEWGVKWIPLGAKLLELVLDIGFELVDRIIWFKTPVKGFQYGSLPYPPSPLICDSMEYIFILRKPGKSNYTHITDVQRKASLLRREEYTEYTKQIWTMGRVRLRDNINGHIAPYPDELPLRCIKMYSFVGETVLDPFGGSGTTTKMANQSKRNSVLYEINEEFLPHIKEKVDMYQKKLVDDSKFVIINER